jgi:phenylacetate-CoA ligase
MKTGHHPDAATGVRRPPAPGLLLLRMLLGPLDQLLRSVGHRYGAFIWLVSRTPAPVFAKLGYWRAVRAADHALRRVPAFAALCSEHGVTLDEVRRLATPSTDKAAYVNRWTLGERCVGGKLPERDTAIDESSGSTGTPYNWIRSLAERQTSHYFISHFARYDFGLESFVTINAFSMGAWATGVNMGIALQRNGIVKNTGPDLDKILNTLAFLGPDHPYLMTGYPPFLKHVIDTASERGFPLGEYRLMALVGGEGLSEGLRDYLSTHFDPVYSGYGATDLEIGIAGETPLSVAIRRAARRDDSLRHALFGEDSRLPMLFQYNPLNHYIETSPEGELMFTLSRLEILSPRIRYNIHDEGGAASFEEIRERIHGAARSIRDLMGEGQRRPLKLPFLWIYGRKDSTVSVMGANIYPEDLEQALYDEPELAAITHSFCLGLREESDGGVRPEFSFEISAEITPTVQAMFGERVTERIRLLNADFREAMREHPDTTTPLIRLYQLGEGPFTKDAGKIKQTRVIRVGT